MFVYPGMESNDIGVADTIGDFQICLTKNSDPYEHGFSLKFSRTGVKKELVVTGSIERDGAPYLDCLVQAFEEIKEDVDEGLVFECCMCGKSLEPDSGSPYKCECGSKKFESLEFESVEKVTEDFVILVYEHDGQVKLELKSAHSGGCEIFEEVHGSYGEIVEVLKEAQRFLKEEEEECFDPLEEEADELSEDGFQKVREVIDEVSGDSDSASVEAVVDRCRENYGFERDRVEYTLEKMKREGEAFEPKQGDVQRI